MRARLFTLSPRSKEVSSLTALLRLSQKYSVGQLRQRVLADLSEFIPSGSWDDFQSKRKLYRARVCTLERVSHTAPLVAGLLAAVEDANYPLLLPFLMYKYARYFGQSLLWGATLSSGQPLTLPAEGDDAQAQPEHLPWFVSAAAKSHCFFFLFCFWGFIER